ncbi:MAG: hypothetical protein V7607_179 [Solirubrobacteraceae bacterium]|jgi:ABC-type nitrate/sulfonate/bicarbonate transport system permease component
MAQQGVASSLLRLPRRDLARRRVATRRDPTRLERRVLGTSGIVLVLGIWQVLASAGVIDQLTASSPSRIATAAKDLAQAGTLWSAMGSSAKLFGIGFGISLVGGLLLGLLLGWYKRVEAVLDPWVSILYATPRLALLPLITVWFGIGLKAQVVVVVLIAIFPIIINTASGVATIDRDHLRVARSFLATNTDVLRTVALPGATPAVVAGIRQGLMQTLIGVVVAEYLFGNTGIGGMIFTAGLSLQTGQAFVGALVFAIAALILSAALRLLERRLDRWRV